MKKFILLTLALVGIGMMTAPKAEAFIGVSIGVPIFAGGYPYYGYGYPGYYGYGYPGYYGYGYGPGLYYGGGYYRRGYYGRGYGYGRGYYGHGYYGRGYGGHYGRSYGGSRHISSHRR